MGKPSPCLAGKVLLQGKTTGVLSRTSGKSLLQGKTTGIPPLLVETMILRGETGARGNDITARLARAPKSILGGWWRAIMGGWWSRILLQ